MKKIGQVQWLTKVKRFEGERGNFEFDAGGNWQPMKTPQNRGYMKRAPRSCSDNSAKGILNALEAVNRQVWQAVKQGVAIVQFRHD